MNQVIKILAIAGGSTGLLYGINGYYPRTTHEDSGIHVYVHDIDVAYKILCVIVTLNQ